MDAVDVCCCKILCLFLLIILFVWFLWFLMVWTYQQSSYSHVPEMLHKTLTIKCILYTTSNGWHIRNPLFHPRILSLNKVERRRLCGSYAVSILTGRDDPPNPSIPKNGEIGGANDHDRCWNKHSDVNQRDTKVFLKLDYISSLQYKHWFLQ